MMNARSWPICESTGWLEKRLMLNMIEVIMGFDNKWNLLKKVVNGFLFLLVYYLFVCYILQIIYFGTSGIAQSILVFSVEGDA